MDYIYGAVTNSQFAGDICSDIRGCRDRVMAVRGLGTVPLPDSRATRQSFLDMISSTLARLGLNFFFLSVRHG